MFSQVKIQLGTQLNISQLSSEYEQVMADYLEWPAQLCYPGESVDPIKTRM
jgi:hypothetical protein